MKLYITLTFLLGLATLNAQQITGVEKTDSLVYEEDEPRFFGVDYKVVIPQTPTSDNYNLDGLDISTTSLKVDLAYAWYLDEKKEKSVLLTRLDYSNKIINYNIKNSEQERFDNEIPTYIYQMPSIHNIGLNFLFNHKFKNHWELSASTELIHSSDLKSFIKKEDLNSTSYIYINKKLGKFNLAGGVAFYFINSKITAFPLVTFGYVSKKLSFELTPPLSLTMDYKLNKKSKLEFDAGLILTGFNVNYSNLSNSYQPDFITDNGIDFSFGFDRRFYKTFHYKICTDYIYREVSYLEKGVIVDKLINKDGVSFSISLYSTF